VTAVVGRLALLDEYGRVAVAGLLDGGAIAGEVVLGESRCSSSRLMKRC